MKFFDYIKRFFMFTLKEVYSFFLKLSLLFLVLRTDETRYWKYDISSATLLSPLSFISEDGEANLSNKGRNISRICLVVKLFKLENNFLMMYDKFPSFGLFPKIYESIICGKLNANNGFNMLLGTLNIESTSGSLLDSNVSL